MGMTEERCGYVTERAEDRLCATCRQIRDLHIPGQPEGRHPFLGRPVAVCGHEESEHYQSPAGLVCSLCLDAVPLEKDGYLPNNVGNAAHTYTPARLCETCAGEAQIVRPNLGEFGWWALAEDAYEPCPAGCVLGLVLT